MAEFEYTESPKPIGTTPVTPAETPSAARIVAAGQNPDRKYFSERYNMGYEITDGEFRILSGILERSNDWESDSNRFAQALMYSKAQNMPLDVTYQNLDAINEAFTGQKAQYTKTWTKAIKDSLDIGILNRDRSELGYLQMKAEERGEDSTDFINQIKALDERIMEKQDRTPRNWFVNLLKVTAQSIPYTIDVATKSTAVGMGAAVLAPLAPAIADVFMPALAGASEASIPVSSTTMMALAQNAYSGAASVAAWNRTKNLSSGEVYHDLREKGVEKNIAANVAYFNGVIQGAIETSLGLIPGMSKAVGNAIGVHAGASLSSKVFAGMYARGTIGGIAAGLTNYILQAGGEGLEEFLQSLADNAAECIALTLSKEANYTFDKSGSEVLKEALTEGLAGFGSALLLGLGPAYINTISDIDYAKKLKYEAEQNPSKTLFIERHKEDEQFGDMSEVEREDTLEKIYEKNHKVEGISNTEAETLDTDYLAINELDEQADEEETEAETTDTPTEPIKRRKDDRLHTQESTTVEEMADGSEKHTLKLGSADSRRRYGRIEFTVKDNTVTIDNVFTKAGQQNLTGEFVTELMRRYAGYNIEWNPTSASQLKVKEQLIKDNTVNPGQLQMFKARGDLNARIEAAQRIKQQVPSLNMREATLAAGLFQIRAENEGKTLNDFLNDNIIIGKMEDAIAKGIIDEKDAKGKKGLFYSTGNAAKAFVYIGKDGNISTLYHEYSHWAIKNSPEAAAKLARALKKAADTKEFRAYLDQHYRILNPLAKEGVVDKNNKYSADRVIELIKTMPDDVSKWTTQHHEIAAYLGETYFHEGRTFNNELKSLFDKIIEWFMKVYRLMKQSAMLNDDIIKAYDEIMAGNPELKAKAEQQEKAETYYSSKTEEEQAEAQYNEVIAKYKGTDQWLKAPNGQPTNLTERQWVQVRTPAFKTWFGDWENDPANASKVVDENGEPLVVYHGTDASERFDVFDGDYVFFDDTQEDAEYFSRGFGKEKDRRIIPAFLKIDNPFIVNARGKEWNDIKTPKEIKSYIDESTTTTDELSYITKATKNFSGVIIKNVIEGNGSRVNDYIAFEPTQIKSATDNIGTFSQSNPSILFQRDAEYEEAVKNGDIEKAQAMLAEEAERKGYSADSDYQGSLAFNGSAPAKNGYYDTKEERKEAWDNGEYEGSEFSLGDFVDNKIDTHDLEWTLDNPIPASGRDPNTLASIRNLASAVKNKKRTIKMYRAVDSDIKENSFRNGDWITPSKEYAKKHITLQDWKKGRVIEQEVSIDDIWWNGDDINEWGYDDGKGYVYKNTPNNRKLFEITYDENGNLIPLSQRFNEQNNSLLYQSKSQEEIEDDMIAEAKEMATEGNTIEDWVTYNRQILGSEIPEDELRKYWEIATHVREIEGEKVADTSYMSEDEKDATFKELISTDEGIKKVIDDMRMAVKLRDDINREGSTDPEEQQRAMAINDALATLEMQKNIIASLVMGKKDLSEYKDGGFKSARGIMEHNLSDYRDLYAKMTGRGELSMSLDALPFIDEPTKAKIELLTFPQKRKLLERIENEDLKKKILKGEETYEGAAEKVITMLDDDIKKLEKEREKIKETLSDKAYQLDENERKLVRAYEEAQEKEKAIKDLERNIRARLDKGIRIPSEDYKKLSGWKDRLELLQKEVNDLNKQTRLKTIVKERDRYRNKLAEIRQKQKQRQALKELHEYKVKLATFIQKKPSKTVNWEQAEKILAIQALFGKPSGYENEYITIGGQKLSIPAFREMVEKGAVATDEKTGLEYNTVIAGLTDYQLNRYMNKSLAEYTVEDLEYLANVIKGLTDLGRQAWQAKVDQRAYEAEMWQQVLLNELSKNPRFTDADTEPLPETAENEKTRRSIKQMVRTGWQKTLNMARKAQMIDGNHKAVAYKLLIEDKRFIQSQEYAAIRKRMIPVTKLMEKLGVKAEDFYDTYTINLPGRHGDTFTVSQLIYGIKSQMEQRNRDAFVYGNLINQGEKASYGHNNEKIEALGEERYKAFIEQAEAILKDKKNLMDVADAIWKDWQNRDNFRRLNQAAVDEYNQPIDPVQFYMPIDRKDFNGTELASKLADDFYNQNAGKNMTTPEQGMLKGRQTITADQQMPVNDNYFKLWTDSVADQEHFIASNAYVRKLNRIFKAFGSKDLRAGIQTVFGEGMMNDIDNYINEIANPNIDTDTQGVNKFLKLLRGALYPAYLAFKSSSVILQMITSPAPFLREVGAVGLAEGLIQMTLHPMATWRFVTRLSPMMENRSMNPLIDEIEEASKKYSDPKYLQLWHKIQAMGTEGLELADRWSVTAGWLAVYKKKKNEFTANGMDEKEARIEAARYADNVVLESQPTGDKTELAPLFKVGGPAMQAFTQFQVSLNVIWNNLTYDVLFSDRVNHERRKAMGTLIGYAMAGALLYLVQEGFDDDDDAEDRLLKILYGATTQYTSSIPLVSSNIDNIIRSKMTGEAWYSRGSQLYPGLDTLGQGVSNMNAKKIMQGMGIMFGAPVSGPKEFWHAIYSKKNKKWRFYPAAFLGRRED